MGTRSRASLSKRANRVTLLGLLRTSLSRECSISKVIHLLPLNSGILEFKDVFVPDKNKLAKADNFETGLSKCLMESRLTITYMFIGGMAGAYEAAYKYSLQRMSFGRPIAAF